MVAVAAPLLIRIHEASFARDMKATTGFRCRLRRSLDCSLTHFPIGLCARFQGMSSSGLASFSGGLCGCGFSSDGLAGGGNGGLNLADLITDADEEHGLAGVL